jgi:hypothetical protein
VLHPARLREDLAKLLLGAGYRCASVVKRNTARAGGALVEGNDNAHAL